MAYGVSDAGGATGAASNVGSSNGSAGSATGGGSSTGSQLYTPVVGVSKESIGVSKESIGVSKEKIGVSLVSGGVSTGAVSQGAPSPSIGVSKETDIVSKPISEQEIAQRAEPKPPIPSQDVLSSQKIGVSKVSDALSSPSDKRILYSSADTGARDKAFADITAKAVAFSAEQDKRWYAQGDVGKYGSPSNETLKQLEDMPMSTTSRATRAISKLKSGDISPQNLLELQETGGITFGSRDEAEAFANNAMSGGSRAMSKMSEQGDTIFGGRSNVSGTTSVFLTSSGGSGSSGVSEYGLSTYFKPSTGRAVSGDMSPVVPYSEASGGMEVKLAIAPEIMSKPLPSPPASTEGVSSKGSSFFKEGYTPDVVQSRIENLGLFGFKPLKGILEVYDRSAQVIRSSYANTQLSDNPIVARAQEMTYGTAEGLANIPKVIIKTPEFVGNTMEWIYQSGKATGEGRGIEAIQSDVGKFYSSVSSTPYALMSFLTSTVGTGIAFEGGIRTGRAVFSPKTELVGVQSLSVVETHGKGTGSLYQIVSEKGAPVSRITVSAGLLEGKVGYNIPFDSSGVPRIAPRNIDTSFAYSVDMYTGKVFGNIYAVETPSLASRAVSSITTPVKSMFTGRALEVEAPVPTWNPYGTFAGTFEYSVPAIGGVANVKGFGAVNYEATANIQGTMFTRGQKPMSFSAQQFVNKEVLAPPVDAFADIVHNFGVGKTLIPETSGKVSLSEMGIEQIDFTKYSSSTDIVQSSRVRAKAEPPFTVPELPRDITFYMSKSVGKVGKTEVFGTSVSAPIMKGMTKLGEMEVSLGEAQGLSLKGGKLSPRGKALPTVGGTVNRIGLPKLSVDDIMSIARGNEMIDVEVLNKEMGNVLKGTKKTRGSGYNRQTEDTGVQLGATIKLGELPSAPSLKLLPEFAAGTAGGFGGFIDFGSGAGFAPFPVPPSPKSTPPKNPPSGGGSGGRAIQVATSGGQMMLQKVVSSQKVEEATKTIEKEVSKMMEGEQKTKKKMKFGEQTNEEYDYQYAYAPPEMLFKHAPSPEAVFNAYAPSPGRYAFWEATATDKTYAPSPNLYAYKTVSPARELTKQLEKTFEKEMEISVNAYDFAYAERELNAFAYATASASRKTTMPKNPKIDFPKIDLPILPPTGGGGKGAFPDFNMKMEFGESMSRGVKGNLPDLLSIEKGIQKRMKNMGL